MKTHYQQQEENKDEEKHSVDEVVNPMNCDREEEKEVSLLP